MDEYAGVRPRSRRWRYILAIVATVAVLAATVLWIARWWTYESPPLLSLAEASASCNGADGPFEASTALCVLPERVDALTDYWAEHLGVRGDALQAPRVLVYRGRADTYCGPAVEADEAFYCPSSSAVYLDVDAMEFYESDWGPAPTMWLLAHEWGHHVQEVIGPDSITESADEAVATRLELQADCLGGLVISALREQYSSEEIEDVLLMAKSFGDDAVGGDPDPADDDASSVPHGSGQQRVDSVERGLAADSPSDCSGPVVIGRR